MLESLPVGTVRNAVQHKSPTYRVLSDESNQDHGKERIRAKEA